MLNHVGTHKVTQRFIDAIDLSNIFYPIINKSISILSEQNSIR